MTHRGFRRLRLSGIGWCLLFAIVGALPLPAQSVDWEKAAGSKMSFDVASVKQNTSGKFAPPNFALDDGDTYPGNTTLFSATAFPLTTYIGFAYKLPQFERQVVQSQLPKWALTETFDIEARSASPATKDQMRLMMQSLLADRFKLKIHFETNEKPIFDLVLVKSGKLGPQLHSYAADPPCSNTASSGPDATGLKTAVGEFPPMCYTLMGFMRYMNGARIITWGSRNVSMRQIANDMTAAPTANLGRPVIDQTGLTGNFDFVMNYGEPTPVTPDGAEPDDSGPSFLEALKEQLGLKLDSATGAIESPIIDRIEEPTAN